MATLTLINKSSKRHQLKTGGDHLRVDMLVAEIGSTTTMVTAFDQLACDNPVFLGQGQAPTSVLEGNVCIGLQKAIDDLCRKIDIEDITYHTMLASSSAAGGLRMTVHGLVYDMTVKAAKEAALGAGANLHLTTAGILQEEDLQAIRQISPNVILLSGGTDYGERKTTIENAKLLRTLNIDVPIIYAGNIQNCNVIENIFEGARAPLYLADHVYPRLDDLNVEPTRKIIHRVFEENITKAPGMEHIRDMVSGPILPTPGAVMECAKLLYQEIGDLLVVDVGGATTDIHSVAEGSEKVSQLQIAPEPMAKRTVEGDLGVYANARKMAEKIGVDQLEQKLGIDILKTFEQYKPIPESVEQVKLTEWLAEYATEQALKRHCGQFRHIYGTGGRITYADGKDLTQIKYIVATGGALTRLPGHRRIVSQLRQINREGNLLYPQPDQIHILEDGWYCMAALGVLSQSYPNAALQLLKQDLKLR